MEQGEVAGEARQEAQEDESDEGGGTGGQCTHGNVLARRLEVTWQVGSCHDARHSGEQDSKDCEEVHLGFWILTILAVVGIKILAPEIRDSWHVGLSQSMKVSRHNTRGVTQGHIERDWDCFLREEGTHYRQTTNWNLNMWFLSEFLKILLYSQYLVFQY